VRRDALVVRVAPLQIEGGAVPTYSGSKSNCCIS
jgi:hypothetical protein